MLRQPLNFPAYRFRICLRGGAEHIWDPLRGAWLRCTPEEWVRQHVVRWLCEAQGVAGQHIVQEYPVCLSGTAQRADVVVARPGRSGPLLLAECKAPGVGIDAAALAQAVRYNSVVGARYLMLTDGLKHYFYGPDGAGGYMALSAPPDLADAGG